MINCLVTKFVIFSEVFWINYKSNKQTKTHKVIRPTICTLLKAIYLQKLLKIWSPSSNYQTATLKGTSKYTLFDMK